MSSPTSSLSENLHNMNIASNAKIPPKVVERARAMDLPVPNIDTGERKIVYGFNITEEWLIEYIEAYWDKYTDIDYSDLRRGEKMIESYMILRQACGMMYLGFESGVVDDVATAEGTIIYDGGGRPMVPLLSVCTSRRGSYRRRPTQEQFDRLKEIVGKEPRWWVDFDDYAEDP